MEKIAHVLDILHGQVGRPGELDHFWKQRCGGFTGTDRFFLIPDEVAEDLGHRMVDENGIPVGMEKGGDADAAEE